MIKSKSVRNLVIILGLSFLLSNCGLKEKYEDNKRYNSAIKNKNWVVAYWDDDEKKDIKTTKVLVNYVINNTNQSIAGIVTNIRHFPGNQLENASGAVKNDSGLQNVIQTELSKSLDNEDLFEAYTWNRFLSRIGEGYTNNLRTICEKAEEKNNTDLFYKCAVEIKDVESLTKIVKNDMKYINKTMKTILVKEDVESRLWDKHGGYSEERNEVSDEIDVMEKGVEKAIDRLKFSVPIVNDKSLAYKASIEAIKFMDYSAESLGFSAYLFDQIFPVVKVADNNDLLNGLGRRAQKDEYDYSAFDAFYAAGNKKEIVKLGMKYICRNCYPEAHGDSEIKFLKMCYLATGNKKLGDGICHNMDYIKPDREIKPL